MQRLGIQYLPRLAGFNSPFSKPIFSNYQSNAPFYSPTTIITRKCSTNEHAVKIPPVSWFNASWQGGIIGVLKGAFGGMVGLGGGVIAVPLLTSLAKLSQHAAHGTSLPGVLASGIIGAGTFYVYGGKGKSVDVGAALVLGACAFMVTPLGARWANALPEKSLKRLLGAFMLGSIPLVFLHRKEEHAPAIEPEQVATVTPAVVQHEEKIAQSQSMERVTPQLPVKPSDTFFSPTSLIYQPEKLAGLVALGALTGFCSGVFGIGGGVVLVPGLSLLSNNQQLALGTSLMAMIAPSAIGTWSHYKLGNLSWKHVPALLVASGIGAWIGGKIALTLTDSQQRAVFCATMLALAIKTLR